MKAPLVLALVLVACQPWYRDAARRGRTVLDHDRTATELAQARHAGRGQRCVEILRATVRRAPMASGEVWLELVECELAVGDVARARADARWKLARTPTSDPAAAPLRAKLIGSLASEGLVAQALDLVESPTLQAALVHPALATHLSDAESALRMARWPNQIQLGLEIWLDRYGEPDHPILRELREQIAVAMWDAAARVDAPSNLVVVRAMPRLVREELAAGDIAGALLLYARARALLPSAVIEPLRSDVERAAAAAQITALVPDVHAWAREGDAALSAGKLGVAIARYRRVVARAPWWAAARSNLDAMLALDRSSQGKLPQARTTR